MELWGGHFAASRLAYPEVMQKYNSNNSGLQE